MILIDVDHVAMTPKDELFCSWDRIPSKHASGTSLRGRVICLIKIPLHALSFFIKPLLYGYIGTFSIIIFKILI